jgi:hypothetical protein
MSAAMAWRVLCANGTNGWGSVQLLYPIWGLVRRVSCEPETSSIGWSFGSRRGPFADGPLPGDDYCGENLARSDLTLRQGSAEMPSQVFRRLYQRM